jgi:hypothetical protein
MGDIEWNVKFKAKIRNDIGFYSFENRKILKDEMVFEHQEMILKNTNRKFVTEECELNDFNINLFIGKINIQTKAKCFAG